jgi:trehalose utilization protein
MVYREGWPTEGVQALQAADAIVVYCDGAEGNLLNRHLDEMETLMQEGMGLACLHFAVEVPEGKAGDAFQRWLGGYFQLNWSVNPTWRPEFAQLPDHPIARGVKPFAIEDEWYFHMRFRPNLAGVTPILSAVAPADRNWPDGPRSGNPAVRQAIAQGKPQHVAWAFERADGGRGFGFTGGHWHRNWGDDNFRKVVLNGIAWTARAEVPQDGVASATPTPEELEANQDEPKP